LRKSGNDLEVISLRTAFGMTNAEWSALFSGVGDQSVVFEPTSTPELAASQQRDRVYPKSEGRRHCKNPAGSTPPVA